MCGNPRKFFGNLTVQEKIADITEREFEGDDNDNIEIAEFD